MSEQNEPATRTSWISKSSAHRQCAIASFIFAAYLVIAGIYHPLRVIIQNDIFALLFVACGIGHLNRKRWAYGLTAVLTMIILAICIFIPLLIGSRITMGLLPNLILVWVVVTNESAKKNTDTEHS